jgi:hypothetical protein
MDVGIERSLKLRSIVSSKFWDFMLKLNLRENLLSYEEKLPFIKEYFVEDKGRRSKSSIIKGQFSVIWVIKMEIDSYLEPKWSKLRIVEGEEEEEVMTERKRKIERMNM